MYVCVCNAVTESQVYEAIDAGATTVKALNRQLGIGAQCGACVSRAKECLTKTREQRTNLPANVFPIVKQKAA
jgi:bacterioferritin-associated ferredoxin